MKALNKILMITVISLIPFSWAFAKQIRCDITTPCSFTVPGGIPNRDPVYTTLDGFAAGKMYQCKFLKDTSYVLISKLDNIGTTPATTKATIADRDNLNVGPLMVDTTKTNENNSEVRFVLGSHRIKDNEIEIRCSTTN